MLNIDFSHCNTCVNNRVSFMRRSPVRAAIESRIIVFNNLKLVKKIIEP